VLDNILNESVFALAVAANFLWLTSMAAGEETSKPLQHKVMSLARTATTVLDNASFRNALDSRQESVLRRRT
jgi:hypothetical protein